MNDESIAAPLLPRQKKTWKQKNKEWYKENIDAGVNFARYDREYSLRSSRKEKVSNVNLFNDIVDPVEVESAVNPYNYDADFPSTYKNFPIANSGLNLLFGEERKRYFNPIAYIVNNDIPGGRQDEITSRFKQFIQEQLTNPEFNKEEADQELVRLEKWRKYTFQDSYERTVNQIMRYFLHATDIKESFSKNFEDLLIQGEEMGVIESNGGKLQFRRVNPLDIYSLRVNNSWKIEDSGLIVEQNYRPVPQILDQFHEELSATDLKTLENRSFRKTSPTNMYKDGQLLNQNYSTDEVMESVGIDGELYGGVVGVDSNNQDFDDHGNIRVTKVLWKGMRKIGNIEYMDEDGTTQKKIVDERYPVNKDAGESVKWEWISEWYEGTKLGADVYVKYGPLPVQFRDPENPSICKPPFVGNILNTGSAQAKSLLSYLKPYQLQYNFFAHRLKQDFIKYKGHIAKLNLSMKPDGWSVSKWMYFMDANGFIIEDPFNEGQEGAATGQLAGNMNQGSGSTQIGDFNLIQANMMMMDMLKREMDELSGVSPQRKGAVENRETKGGVERSVMQSSNNTEKYYAIHDNYRLRVLKVIVETALYMWKDAKMKKSFVLDDGTRQILDFVGENMQNIGAVGITASTSSDTMDMINSMKELSQAYMQNGGKMSEMVDIWTTKDPASLKRKLEQYEEDRLKQEEEIRKNENAKIQAQIQANEKEKAEEREFLIKLEEMKTNRELTLKAMELGDSAEIEKLQLARDKLESELNFKEKQLGETKRHNVATESISKRKTTK